MEHSVRAVSVSLSLMKSGRGWGTFITLDMGGVCKSEIPSAGSLVILSAVE